MGQPVGVRVPPSAFTNFHSFINRIIFLPHIFPPPPVEQENVGREYLRLNDVHTLTKERVMSDEERIIHNTEEDQEWADLLSPCAASSSSAPV